jgi:hypothetical protein
MTDDRMLARIAALLRQAEGTDNPHEAEAFMTAAQRLATATSIDLAVARAHSATRTAAQEPTQRTITIGEPGSKGLRTYVQLFAGIAVANDVRCDVASNSAYVYAYGFAEDIDASHALYASLVVQMVRAAQANDWKKALAMHDRLFALFTDLFLDTNPIPVKAAMAMAGMIEDVYRLPLCEMAPAPRAKLRATLAALGLVKA